MGRGRQVFAAALVVSLLVHLGLMAKAGRWWALPGEEVPFPIEASLVAASQPVAPVAGPDSGPPPAPPPAAPAPVSAEPVTPADPVPQPEPVSEPAPVPVPEPVAPPAPRVEAPPASVPEPVPEPAESAKPAPRLRARALPEKLQLVYDVRAGDNGFNLGQATYSWQAKNGRYRLESVAEATGLASLFVSGRIVQTSEGRIGPEGLMPDQFQMTRNNKRQFTAHFDWQRMQLDLSKGSEPLRNDSQDLLSFPFHLAMTVTEDTPYWILPVTNGRKFRGYRFTVLGREQVEAGKAQLETLHIQGVRANEGNLDVWLAPGLNWLPVRIRTEDDKGQPMELVLAS